MSSRVLICDDDPDIRTVVGLNLGLAGMDYAEASDGKEAIAALHAGWDALILDLMMPHTDGFDVLKSLPEDLDDLVIVVLSARTNPTDAARALQMGAHAHVSKPFSPGALAQLLTDLLAMSPADREAHRVSEMNRAADLQRMGMPNI